MTNKAENTGWWATNKQKVLATAKHTLLLCAIVAYLLVAYSMTADRINAQTISKVVVNIDKSGNRFIGPDDIINKLADKGMTLVGQNIESVNLNTIEREVRKMPSVRNAEVYRIIDGRLGIQVIQRHPILHIYPANDVDYYIDNEGRVMPSSKNYTAHVIVVSGYINERYIDHNGENIAKMAKPGKSSGKLLPDLFTLVNYLNSDKIWAAQFEQIYINQQGDIELVPRIGNHVVLIGDIDNLYKKFRNLHAFYKQGFEKYGWNKYRILNLKYENQIVCVKR